uniref:DNA topoisomerase (ATP-hydrolyzing) n=1 Tax=viral metagenome TaxID=1070528 RepID=A0A6C0FAP4_9ZZZZ|tara:strand:- start:1165 stop:4596 length:3432 start_codon:yes stop_codon:yes gene_type:complete
MSAKNLSSQYQKKDLHSHIYDTPDTYVGGCDLIEESLGVFDDTQNRIVTAPTEFIPALYNIFNEILVNSRDQVIRLQTSGGSSDIPVKSIRVEIDAEKGQISVYNDGSGIDVVEHPTETKNGKPLYIPEMIFGHLLTSTNYNKQETKVVGGKNGYGAKLTNIFSTKFKLETVDHVRQKKYVQEFSNNMRQSKKPKITDYDKKPYTRITWIADFQRFGVDGYSDSMISLMKRRVYDIAGITDPKVSVSLNKHVLKVKTFPDYAKMYLEKNAICLSTQLGERWSLCVSLSEDKFEQVSFVNGIATSKGGKHVDTVTKMLTSALKAQIKKRAKRDVNETYIKNYLKVFLDCMIDNPSFDSQTKERLITPASKFGSKPVIPDKFVKQILDKTELLDRVLQFTEFKMNKESKKTDGRKRSKIRDIPKLDDANWAGTKRSEECILILTEGDSAKTMAISGLSVVGRDRYGVFPLRGKVLNVKEASQTQITNNSEVTNLKKILGLESGKVYQSTKSLRYGSIMIMTDQDHDGSHIKGLLMNLFHTLWPSLLNLKDKNFLTAMITPIVKVTKGKHVKSFYTMTDYEHWQESTSDHRKWHVKYYKGLGTSSASEARDYFRQLKINEFLYTSETDDSMSLAFSKSEADKRKEWLYQYDHSSILDHNSTHIPIKEFINKELIHFSNSDTFRSIGSLYDGLKPSQRKVLYACLKRHLYKEIKVAQLSGYVSETSAYHHGEASLQSTIIGMAQTFVGSNNLNLLMPNGQFGTRIQGGHDSASPRYIHTELNPIVQHLFPKEDMSLLEYNVDDGQTVEPLHYLPIIPLVLVNGMNGIGTGFSSHVPKFSITDVTENILRRMRGEGYKPMAPYYNGFTGQILKVDDKTYMSKGVYKVVNNTTIEITELPIGKWTDDYKKFLDSLLPDDSSAKKSKEKKKKPKYSIVDYQNNSSDTRVHFTVTLPQGMMASLQWSEDPHIDGIEKYFKLTTTKGLSLNNIHLYNGKQQIQKYLNLNEIMDEFYEARRELYVKRKDSQLKDFEREITILDARIRFLRDVMEDRIVIYKRKKPDIIQDLRKHKYPQVHDKQVIPVDQHDTSEKTHHYDYLVKMSLLSFTEEELHKLQQEYSDTVCSYKTLQQTSIDEIWSSECGRLVESLK